MAANFEWDEDNGAGKTQTHGVTNVNWKNIDDATTTYSSYPVTAGNNSYTKWQYGHFSGTYNQLLNGKFGHTVGTLGTGLTLKSQPAMTVDGDKLTYSTPSASILVALTNDMTSPNSIATSGIAVWFSGTGPEAAKTASTTANPAYTNYLTTQVITTPVALPGDSGIVTLSLVYDEN
jgi:hypothetical protein